jgi:hypothetical protein
MQLPHGLRTVLTVDILILLGDHGSGDGVAQGAPQNLRLAAGTLARLSKQVETKPCR